MRTPWVLGLLIALWAATTACDRTRFFVTRRWFATEGGVVLGAPGRGPDGRVSLPLVLVRERDHTPEVVRRIVVQVEADGIVLAIEGGPPGPRWPVWDGTPIDLGNLPAGLWAVWLQEPRGPRVLLGRIEVS